MKWLRAPNPVDVAIGVTIATTPYWANWFVTATLPLWSVAAGLGLGAAAFLLLGALRRRHAEKRVRERTDRELHREVLERLNNPVGGAPVHQVRPAAESEGCPKSSAHDAEAAGGDR
jgi:hypothetical protein